MNGLDRDKFRVLGLLKTRRGEAFTAAEISEMTGLEAHRVQAAADALVETKMIVSEEKYYWAVRFTG